MAKETTEIALAEKSRIIRTQRNEARLTSAQRR